jgi:hypothetical protein
MLLLQCLARALAKNALKALASAVPFGSILFDIADSAWNEYKERCREGSERQRSAPAEAPDVALCAEVRALVQTPAAVIRPIRRAAARSPVPVPAGAR